MTRLRQFDLIVFDWDGTLFDSTALIAHSIQAACADLGTAVPTDTEARHVIGLSLAEALALAAPQLPPDLHPLLGQRYRFHYVQRQNDITLFDGTLQMLAALKEKNHLLAVATGKSRGGLNEALRTVALAGLFDATRTADETASKPHPLMLQELMAELDVPAHRTLMVGDTTHDLQLAANAGTASVGVSYGAHAPASFAAFSPLHVAHSVGDLSTWLFEHA